MHVCRCWAEEAERDNKKFNNNINIIEMLSSCDYDYIGLLFSPIDMYSTATMIEREKYFAWLSYLNSLQNSQ